MSKFFKDQTTVLKLQRLPLIPLRDMVVFPHMVAPLFVGREKSVRALTNAMNNDKLVFLSTQTKASLDSPSEKDISEIGTIGKVLQLLKLPDGTVKALVEGISRSRIVNFIAEDAFFMVETEAVEDPPVEESEARAMNRALLEAFKEYAGFNKNISAEIIEKVSAITDTSKMADIVASHFPFKIENKQKLLETIPVDERLSNLLGLIKMEIEVAEMDQRIKGRVKDSMEKTQKQYYLNEQMRALKKEMGSEEDPSDELAELEKQISEKKMSEEATEKVQHELKKLKMMAPMSAEATVVRNYIDWIISLPWFDMSEISNDMDQSETILDEDHYGLEKPKERILEYLAVQSLIKKVRGPILCFVGPPGVGKTSLAKSVARATGRKYVRLSLGGVRDEAEIRGHRRTYIGALPGKIIQSLKKAGVSNPVFCLDEVDKMSMDFRGDPSAALLEVLDPEQNNTFSDHYLDLDYDLSDILFITTANTLDIPPALQDRMEVIRLAGYAEYEKHHIAKDFLISKQVGLNGLEGRDVRFSKNAVLSIIQRYTREAGVRNLEREIASICRKIAREVAKNKDADTVYKITANSVSKHLGPPRFRFGQVEEEDQIGMATGLAWTQAGGELLTIETQIMPGKGELMMTGKLGDVMKESAQAAMSYVRTRAEKLKLHKSYYSGPSWYKEIDIHIHVPEGAVPKDGPSAGISMCASIASALIKKPVSRKIAMTGEITLRGRVLPIGGLKEKILAANRGGLTKVIIPKENEKDLRDIPNAILKQIEVVLVEHMDEVISHALVLDEGETVFKEDDASFPMIPEVVEEQEGAPLN